MLIDELSEEHFNPLQFKDEYRDRLLERIKAKAHGKSIAAPEKKEEEGGEVVDIMEALRRSLGGAKAAPARHARTRRAPRRATAKTSKRRKAS
jgi:DNA end-binding protein Ku